MTEAAAVSSIPGEFRDDSLPADPLLQSGTYIDAESNVNVETTKPNKGALPDEGNVPDLTPATTLEMQNTASVAETATPVRQGSRSAEVNVERPSWLPLDWRFEARVRTNGATAGTVDRYYYEPASGTKFRSKTEVLYFLETGGKRKKAITGSGTDATPSETPPSKKPKKSGSKTKKVTSFYFDSGNPPQSVCWVQTDTSADTWTPSCNGSMVPGTRKQEWDAVFSNVSKLKRRNTQTGR
ncbi:methyl-CpG-binding domain-containing protein 5-like [Solanum dulcamara]|uniref:methyl-CpG-binding domain-containing protein 5-like n=1 Tax=Solanum dulcamara TaxID=45834 RepID=UPI002484DA03|nr:methyl-CpG-binding domain-containing protein 5-like [Solanum dulcamara]